MWHLGGKLLHARNILAYAAHDLATGAILRDVPQPGESPEMCGSVVIARAESREEILQALRQDIYNTSGVWNLGQAQIYPVSKHLWSLSKERG